MRHLLLALCCAVLCAAAVLPARTAEAVEKSGLNVQFNFQRDDQTPEPHLTFQVALQDPTAVLPVVTEQDIPALITQLQQEDGAVRDPAFVNLTKLGDPAVEPLSALLQSPDGPTLTNAASILAFINTKKSLAALRRAPVATLVKLATPPTGYTAQRSAFVLAILGGKDANATLASLLRTSEDTQLLFNIFLGAGYGKNTALLPEIEPILRHSTPELRGMAAYAEAILKGAESAPMLIAMLNDRESAARLAVVGALGVLGDERAIEPLITALFFDAEPQTRATAGVALGQFDDARVAPALIRGMTDDDENVRCACVNVSRLLLQRKTAERELLAALHTATQDKSKDVAAAAQQVLDDYNNGKLKD